MIIKISAEAKTCSPDLDPWKISKACDDDAGFIGIKDGLTYDTCAKACEDDADCNLWEFNSSMSDCYLYKYCTETFDEPSADMFCCNNNFAACSGPQPEPGKKIYCRK